MSPLFRQVGATRYRRAFEGGREDTLYVLCERIESGLVLTRYPHDGHEDIGIIGSQCPRLGDVVRRLLEAEESAITPPREVRLGRSAVPRDELVHDRVGLTGIRALALRKFA